MLGDMAVVTGGRFISSDLGDTLADVKLEDYGHARRVVSTENSTMIVDGEGTKENINLLIKNLRKELAKEDIKEFDKEKLEERIAKLTTGIAVLNVGGATEAAMRERKERCIDAIEATDAAIEEGIVPGGETALRECGITVTNGTLPTDVETGIQIVLNACNAPFKKLMENSGYDPGQMSERLLRNPGKGIDVMDGEVKDMIKSGIIDPVKVPRLALENATSAAGSIMTGQTLIVEKKKDEQLPVA